MTYTLKDLEKARALQAERLISQRPPEWNGGTPEGCGELVFSGEGLKHMILNNSDGKYDLDIKKGLEQVAQPIFYGRKNNAQTDC